MNIPERTLLLLAVIAACANSASASTYDGNNFSTWIKVSGGTGSASFTPLVDGSSKITTNTGSSDFAYAGGYSLQRAFINGGSFQVKLSDLAGLGSFGDGQAIGFLIEQNGILYGQHLKNTGVNSTFTSQLYDGTFLANNFQNFSGAGPVNPEFDGITETRLGFYAANSGSGTLTQYYKDFSVSGAGLNLVSSIPEPSTVIILSFGLTLLGLTRYFTRR
nr:hypothetical protein [uncultured Roseateles sp.]